jgi:hypothetical protein
VPLILGPYDAATAEQLRLALGAERGFDPGVRSGWLYERNDGALVIIVPEAGRDAAEKLVAADRKLIDAKPASASKEDVDTANATTVAWVRDNTVTRTAAVIRQ